MSNEPQPETLWVWELEEAATEQDGHDEQHQRLRCLLSEMGEGE